MLDHTSFAVKDYKQSLRFYDETLGVLGYERSVTLEYPEYNIYAAGYGNGIRPSFWVSAGGNDNEQIGSAKGVHVAFIAPSVEAVLAWYHKCLELGGKDNGAPGPRTEYHEGYFGAFIIDPNGWRIEACLHNYKPN